MVLAAVLAFQVATYTLPPVELPRDVSEEAEIVWYPVSGSTLSDLRREMNLHGPHDDEGVRAGMTRTWTHWHVQFGGGDGANPCYMRAVQVTVHDTVTLPLWTPPPHVDSGLVAEWGRFVTMLGRHEAGHRSIALDGAGDIARALAMLPSRASCSDMLAAANAQGQAILATSQGRQKQYDADTQHGVRRGTALENLDGSATSRLPALLIVVILSTLVCAILWAVRSRAR
jgi:predicted secreted Zn-dependent protease